MKTAKQTDPALARLADRLEDQRVAMMTLLEPDHGLASRPMTPLEMDADGALWMIGSRRTLAPAFAGDAGRAMVNLAFVDAGDNDYVSVAGEADLVDDAARKEALWNAMARPWFDGPGDPDLTLVRVRPRHAEVWDGPDSAATRLFAVAASVVAGREIGMGHKETLEPDTGGRSGRSGT